VSQLTTELSTMLQNLEIVRFDIHRLASRRQRSGTWLGWTPKARDAVGIHRELDDLYEKKRMIVGQIEALARGHANDKAESLEATGGLAWEGTGVGIYERTIEMASRTRHGRYALHSDDKQPKGV